MAETVIESVPKQREVDLLAIERLTNQSDVLLYRVGFLDKLGDFFDDIAKRRIICDDDCRTSPL